MAAKETEPKQTNQGGDGRKDERKGVDVGRDIDDHAARKNEDGPGGQNSAGGQWGQNKGKGGNDSHNKR